MFPALPPPLVTLRTNGGVALMGRYWSTPVDKGGPLREGYLVARKRKAGWRCFLAES